MIRRKKHKLGWKSGFSLFFPGAEGKLIPEILQGHFKHEICNINSPHLLTESNKPLPIIAVSAKKSKERLIMKYLYVWHYYYFILALISFVISPAAVFFQITNHPNSSNNIPQLAKSKRLGTYNSSKNEIKTCQRFVDAFLPTHFSKEVKGDKLNHKWNCDSGSQ